MTRNLRILTITLWSIAILATASLLAVKAKLNSAAAPIQILKVEQASLPNIPAPPFSLIDQNNQPFSSDFLKGKVWIADFFFTTCTGPCPLMSAKMSRLDQTLTDPRIHFVSFSIDPESDTPPAMSAYAAKFKPSPRWHFLTGPNNATFDIARALKLPALPAAGDNPIFHTTKFILLNPTGQVAGFYDFNDPASLDQLTKDAQKLADTLPK